MKRKHEQIKTYFPFSWKDALLSLGILAAAAGLCFLLRIIDRSDLYTSMIFILAVFLISRFTDGFLFGTVSSFAGVLAVNYMFTYPYFEFNFTLSGYPLAILCMLAVSIITSTMTTQSKQHEKLQVEAEKEKTRSNLLRAVSHDLRTPLTSIYGASSAIIENDDALTKRERLRLLLGIKEDARWLIRMVENLLSITRIDGAAKITKTPEAAEELIEESITKFRKNFQRQRVAVRVPPELLMVPMDAMLIEQVLINLLENAAIHSKSSIGIEIEVTCADGFAVFEVRDRGIGIPEDILPGIFDGGLHQPKKGGGDCKKNMGIGLSVCKTIIEAHDGEMTAENRDGGGALFRFTLPMEG